MWFSWLGVIESESLPVSFLAMAYARVVDLVLVRRRQLTSVFLLHQCFFLSPPAFPPFLKINFLIKIYVGEIVPKWVVHNH